jgi:predicted nucleotide-binding protein
MTKKVQSRTPEKDETVLIKHKEEFKKFLDERIVIGEEILKRQITTKEEFKKNQIDFSNWNDYNSEYLKHAFNKENNEYKRIYDKISFYSLRVNTSTQQQLEQFKEQINLVLNNLIQLRAKTDLLKSTVEEKYAVTEKSLSLDKSEVFIVHGHDDAAKNKTARFIEKLGLKPIILHEQPSGSKTVIEKIEAYSNVGFGIVLYTPCDIGTKNEEKPNLKNRARQNVVFEHGFLIGKIGRENVCALVKDEIETPNDISGVVYVKMDDEDAWHLKIARELRNSGYNIDMNKVI